ncbi:MAG: isochorismatase family protein [Pseudomonadota bacterium]
MNSLEDSYAHGFDAHLGFGASPALILVDFVKAYFEPDSPLYAGVEAVLEQALALVDVARSEGLPIIYTRVRFEPGGADGGVFYRKLPALSVFDRDNPLGDWAPGVSPGNDEIIVTKQYPSAFFNTGLETQLHALGVDTLIISGVTTSGCVRATCVDAMGHGFIPIVVRDACGDRHATPHESNLFDMQAKYADIVDSADVLATLQSRGTS